MTGEPTPRAGRDLTWDGCFNVRELGGLPTSAGRQIRHGALVRSDSIDNLTATGWAALQADGVMTVVDLRNDDERAADRSPRPRGLTTVHVPLDGVAPMSAAGPPAQAAPWALTCSHTAGETEARRPKRVQPSRDRREEQTEDPAPPGRGMHNCTCAYPLNSASSAELVPARTMVVHDTAALTISETSTDTVRTCSAGRAGSQQARPPEGLASVSPPELSG